MATATSPEQLKQATTDAVRSTLTQQKDAAASSLGSFASALRKAARESGGGETHAAQVADWAAEGLERVSSTLRGKDLRAMGREVESFARNQPVAFFCAAAAAGFLATRFLKAGSGATDKTDAASTIPF